MSSLRPLATITLLAAVGVVLYMKINETEPVVPAGVGEWTIESPEIGGDGGGLVTSAPATLPAMGDAPAFQASTAPAASPSTSSGDAPPWTPGVLASATAPAPGVSGTTSGTSPATTANAESSPVARTAEAVPAVPTIPPLPSTSAGPETKLTAPDAADAASTTPGPGTAAAAATVVAASTAAAANLTEDAPASSAPGAALESATADVTTPTTPTPTTPVEAATSPEVGFSAARVAVQGALDRGQLAQALLLLSDWYDDPSLTPDESKEVESLLSQLAGSVIYEGPPAHRLEKPYRVQAGDTLDAIAAKYDVPTPLLAKINGLQQSSPLEPGKELKVVRGPFSAVIDLSKRKMTLMLDRRYAGQFAIELDPATTIEEGQWKVDQKLLTPAAPSLYSQAAQPSEERSLLLANPSSTSGQPTVLRGPGQSDLLSNQSRARVITLKEIDVNDVYDILSQGSRVTIRR